MNSNLAETKRLNAKKLASQMENRQLIGGRFAPSRSGATLPVIDPARDEQVGSIPSSDATDTACAVSAATDAAPSWRKITPRERGRLLRLCGEILRQHAEPLAELITLETGKALQTESRPEALNVADVFDFYSGLGGEIKGETIPVASEMLTLTIREPLGVVGAIIPWNVPVMLLAHKIAPALLAGNAIIVKPSEEASLSVLRAAELFNEILPPGVLNIVCGAGPVAGAALVANESIRKVSFTGSTATGRLIAAKAGERLITTTMELGGKSPMIIAHDAELEKAVDGIIGGMRFTRQGQSCSAASRVFIHDSLFARARELVVSKLAQLKMGDPFDAQTDIGSIISPTQYRKVCSYIQEAKTDPQLEVVEIGHLPEAPELARGLFTRPTLVFGADNNSRLAQEEIFGPVCLITPFSDLETVIKTANKTSYGLAAYLWTKDISKALYFADLIEAGFVQINQNIVFRAGTPYGGFKNSGFGKEACLDTVLEDYTRAKTVIVGIS
jgi:aldehyde dehydrogenase (NAD+)